MIFASEPYVLHLLAGTQSISALDAAKNMLDNGTHDANEREPQDNLSPLHIAAAWDNLAMCQLLLHYGANLDALDIDKRKPIDIATGKTRRFLKKLGRKKDRRKIFKIFSYLFGRTTCLEPERNDSSKFFPYKLANNASRKSCPPALPETLIRSVLSFSESQNSQLTSTCFADKNFEKISFSSYETANDINANERNSNTLNKVEINNFPSNNCQNVTIRSKKKIIHDVDREYLSSDLDTPRTSIVKNKENNEPYRRVSNKLYPILNSGDAVLSQIDEIIEDETKFNIKSSVKNNINDLKNEFDKLYINGVNEEKENKLDPLELQLREEFSVLNIDILKKKLKENKCSIGPINSYNQKLYVNKLAKLKMERINEYSQALESMLADESNQTDFTRLMGEAEECYIRREFSQSKSKDEVSYFCYLLIDPSMLPETRELCTLHEFVGSIFYIGKGKGSRPLQHLYNAYQCRDFSDLDHAKKLNRTSSKKITEKLGRILSLWKQGVGVISLNISFNIHSKEAFIREGCMIEAIGLENLTNVRKGQNFPNGTKKQTTEYGASLIRKAHIVFLNERCRPIFENEVSNMSYHFNFYKNKNQNVCSDLNSKQ